MQDLEVIDVINTPGGMEQLKALGVRNVPVVLFRDSPEGRKWIAESEQQQAVEA